MNAKIAMLKEIARTLVPAGAARDGFGAGDGDQRPASAGIATPANGFRALRLSLNGNCRLAFHTDPGGLAAEQYRLLRRKLTSRYPQGATLLITSPAPGDGKTLNAANLAWCLAEGNRPTFLLEADLRRPSMARVFGCVPRHGVEEVLTGEAEPEATVRAVSGVPLCVAMVAKGHDEPIRLFQHPRAKAFLGWARKEFRWVVMDAPPIFPVADVAELCPLVDGALLVVRARRTPRDLVSKSLESLGDRLIGIILNDAADCYDSHYHYLSAYHRYYSQGKK